MTQTIDLTGRNLLITGASSGLGVEFARANVERQIISGENAAEPLHQVLNAEQWIRHG